MEIDCDVAMSEVMDELEKARAQIAKLEQKLNNTSETKFQNLIDASPVPFALNDEQQNIAYLNPAFVNTFGYDTSDIPTLADWWPKAYPNEEYRNWVARIWASRLEVSKESGKPFEPVELYIRCKNGEKRTVMASAASLTNSFTGNHLVILYDITERKSYEEKLHVQEKELVEIFDHIPSMIFLKNASDLSYARFNAAGEKIIGVNRQDLIGNSDYDFFPTEQADFFTGRDREVLESGKLHDIAEEPIDTPHGQLWLRTRKVPINDATGQAKYLLGISDDITEQRKMAKESARLQRELEQAQKMESLGQLTGGIAHDFNNLLAIIAGYTELSLDRCEKQSDPDLVAYLRQVQSAGKRAISLVEQMLAFSRSDKIESKPLHIGTLIKKDVSMLRASLPSTIAIDFIVEQGLPPVMLSPVHLNQIMMNLAVNARDAMNSYGELNISLAWSKDMDLESPVSHESIKGDWIELSVEDTGCGINASEIKDIFTPFYTSKPVGKGTGMGLSVVYGIMKNCGGHILVDSSPGEGTRFRLLFPPLNDMEKDFANVEADTLAPARGKGEHLLIVDDEDALANFVGDILTQYGYDVEVMTDSMAALERIKQVPDKFKLMITDQTMPVLTGSELIKAAKQYSPDIKAILCSGYTGSPDLNESEIDNDVVFFQKPINKQSFIDKVHDMVSKSAA